MLLFLVTKRGEEIMCKGFPAGGMMVIPSRDWRTRLRHFISVTDTDTQRTLHGRSALETAPNLFFADVSGVSGQKDADMLYDGFERAGHRPVFFCPRDVHTTSGISTTTWRYYFAEETIPSTFVVNGHPINRVLCEGRLFYLQTKDAPFPGSNVPARLRAVYQICLPPAQPVDGTVSQMDKGNKKKTQPSSNKQKQKDKDSNKPTDTNANSTAQNSEAPAPTEHDFTVQTGKRTRSRGASVAQDQDRSVAQRKSVSLHDDNYFAVLESVSVSTAFVLPDEKLGVRCAHITAEATIPDDLPHSVIRPLRFQTKKSSRHKAEIGPEVTTAAVATTLLATEPMDGAKMAQELVAAKLESSGIKDKLSKCNTSEAVVSTVAKSPLGSCLAITDMWAQDPESFVEVVDLFTCSRAVPAAEPEVRKNSHERVGQATVPTGSRCAVAAALHELIDEAENDIMAVAHTSRALAAFEFQLMAKAPTLYKSDFWISTLTCGYVDWIAHSTHRLLTARQLCALLVSDIGEHVLRFCTLHGMPAVLLEELTNIRTQSLDNKGLCTAIRPNLILVYDQECSKPKLTVTAMTASSKLSQLAARC